MQTLISVFEDRRAAQRAVDSLLDEGFAPEDVHLQEGVATANTAVSSSPAGRTEPDRGVLSSVGHFFASLFGQDPPSGYPDRYSEAIRRGHSVVVVEATNQEDADRACTALHELGAFDIDERAAQWQGGGMSAGTSSSTGVVMGTGQGMRDEHEYRDGVRLIRRRSGRPLRELVNQHETH
jgi:hypothetical protein